ncbi:hypothetical protein J2S43_003430 [Catenuloplanes nepalensis]|uniref:AraC-type transcription regulator ligand-binding domain-containing protein n=2 Tax=Catenuloplanes nepalensis TaxID=587533 RepID=A0ABT9MTZ7_9ACTN|nr:hypothetical protein [Catenuloplanes nepalensis]
MFQSLPEIVSLPAHPDRYPGLQTSIDLVRAEIAGDAYGTDLVLPALLDVLFVHLVRLRH